MSTPQQVLDDWYERVTVTQRAHYLSAITLGLESTGWEFQLWCFQL
jgi:hypothetical protein